MAKPLRLTATKRLEVIRLAVYSAGETITPAQALALIAAMFTGPPDARINPAQLPDLLALVTPPRRPRPRRIAAPAA